MARRGCASGRRKQLRRLVKALHYHKEFDPSVFDRATPAPPPPPPPAYISYTQPKVDAKTIPAKSAPRSRIPARPSTSDVAPVRRQTRPLPVSAQVKKRGIDTTKSANKPAIISIKTTRFNIRRAGNKIFINKGTSPIQHEESIAIVTTGDSGGMPGIPV